MRGILGRIRRALLALARRAASPVTQLLGTGDTIAVIAAELSAAMRRRLQRALRRDTRVRIGIDVRPFFEPLTGVGWYLHDLMQELVKDERLEIVCFGDPRLLDQGPRLHVALPAGRPLRVFDLRGRTVSRLTSVLTAAAFPILARLEGCEIFFGGNYFLPRPLAAVAEKRVVTVHDLTFRRMPEMLQAETLENLDRQMTAEIFRTDAVICVSESTRRDLLELYHVDPARAVTIHSGIPPVVPPGAGVPGLPGKYLLFVSTIEPRKNLTTLIDAFELLRERGSYDGDLVIVGKVGWKSEATMERIAHSRWRRAIHHLDYLRREQLATVYANAGIFVLPSHYEGFGFPLVEAMSYGVPSIAARTSSLPEVGGDAALYFDPKRPRELAEAIESIEHDPGLRQTLVERGRQRIGLFTWSGAAKRTADLLIRVARS